jgi:hypothetical protein
LLTGAICTVATSHGPVVRRTVAVKKIIHGDILHNLREGDHVIFSLNKESNHPHIEVGYGFVNQVIEDHCASFKDLGSVDVGDVITHTSESGVMFHGIVNHSIEYGWDYECDRFCSYEAILDGLNQLYEKYDDSLTRSMRSLWLGRGKMRRLGKTHGNIIWNLQAMTNSDADLAVYVIDGYTE